MPKFEIITESSTFLTYEVEAENEEEARRIYEAGNAEYTGCTDSEQKVVEINESQEASSHD